MILVTRNVGLFINNGSRAFCSASFMSLNSKRGLIPYSEIPRAPSLPYVGSLLHILKNKTINFHKYVDDLHKELGPIFIDKMFDLDLVHIADADSNFKMYGNEGRYPIHGVPDNWRLHSEFRNHKRGLFFMDGEEWKKSRSPCNPAVLLMRNLEDQVTNRVSITKEFIDTWKNNPPKDDLRQNLYCWNIECIGSTALGKRLGFLDKLRYFNKFDTKHVNEDLFIRDSCQIFSTSANLIFKPVQLYKRFNLKSWQRYCKVADTEIFHGERYVTEALQDCISDNPSEETKRGLLYKLVKSGKLDLGILKRIFEEIFLASASSTSNAAVWVLYSLGKRPEVAEKARQEISSAVKGELTLDILNNKLPYLRGVIRETLRMYPTTPFITRIMANDAELVGHHIPAGSVVMASMYTMGKNPDYFVNPDSFMPERWQGVKRTSGNKLVLNTRAYSPFALGGRSCLGRHIAFTDLQILVIEALKAFEWTTNEVDWVFQLVGMPLQKVKLNLKPYQR